MDTSLSPHSPSKSIRAVQLEGYIHTRTYITLLTCNTYMSSIAAQAYTGMEVN